MVAKILREEPDVEIVGECATAAETIQLVDSAKPDLLFLDILMPGMDGFDVIGALTIDKSFPLPHIIFTTAYDQYAVRAFEIHAVDYLLKPFTSERLRSAVNRVREYADTARSELSKEGLPPNQAGTYAARIIFKSRGRVLFLPVSDIQWIGAQENYVRIYTRSESHLLRETMANLERRLDPQIFLRVHRSSIVNLHYVKEIRTESDGEFSVMLLSGQRVAMSRTYRSRLQEWVHRSP